MNINRRQFLEGTLAAAAMTGAMGASSGQALSTKNTKPEKSEFLWGNLVQLGMNMWSDVPVKSWGHMSEDHLPYVSQADHLRCDEEVWNAITQQMADEGMNLILMDIGEGIQLESHPELAVKGSWSIEKTRQELQRLRSLGLEPIPKLNFSTAHDIWLKEYSRMVSTPAYYRTCADVIREVADIFDKPRFFHLGYDEETYGHQSQYDYVVVRQGELWWHDFLFFVKTVEDLGIRPWIWSDYLWHHQDLFLERMPRSVLQSNWYYGNDFSEKSAYAQAYITLEKHGFDQIPTGSNWACDENFGLTVDFCREHISPQKLKGFLQTPWKATAKPFQSHIESALRLVSEKISPVK